MQSGRLDMKIVMHVTLPPLAEHTAAYHFAPLSILLACLVDINRDIIRKSLSRAALGIDIPIPPLYWSGVRYTEDPPGEENWGDIHYCLEPGATTDCNNLVLWRVAELLEAGIYCEPVIKWQHLPREIAIRLYPATMVSPEGLWLVHCLVRFPQGAVIGYPDGTRLFYPPGGIEDPSKLLGMGGEYTSAA